MHFGYNATSIPIYTVTTLAILLSPCAFIAQDYYVLPKMAEYLEKALQADTTTRYSTGRDNISGDCLFLKPRLIGRIFLTSDVITFLLQLGGSGMAASADLAQTGDKVCPDLFTGISCPHCGQDTDIADRAGRSGSSAGHLFLVHHAASVLWLPSVRVICPIGTGRIRSRRSKCND